MYDTSTIAARLLTLHGEAWVWEGNDRLPVAIGSLLDAGQLLETGPHGTLQLLLASGHELGLGPNQSLLLDADVLADASADISEWVLAGSAAPVALMEWLSTAQPSLSLDAVLDSPSSSLDSLLGPDAQSASSSMASSTPTTLGSDFAGADLAGLLHSLYGTEPGHLG